MRLSALYEIQQEYETEDLLPYLEGYYGDKGQPSSPHELLLKHCKYQDAKWILLMN